MTTGKHTHCTLDYFKEDGKWYSQGEYVIFYEDLGEGERPVPFHRCVSIVQSLLDKGERPGLVNGYGFNVLLTVCTEFGPLQWLFVRGADRSER